MILPAFLKGEVMGGGRSSRFVRSPTRRVLGAGPAPGHGPAGSRARAHVILLSAARVAIPEIIRRLGRSVPNVTQWLSRFEHSAIAGLLDRHALADRPGSPPPYSVTSPMVVRPASDLGIPGTRWSHGKAPQYLSRPVSCPAVAGIAPDRMKRAGLRVHELPRRQIQKGVTTIFRANLSTTTQLDRGGHPRCSPAR